MRVATVDGLVTLFYDGSKELYNDELNDEWLNRFGHLEEDDIEAMDLSNECKSYIRERLSWQQIIVVDGVTEIPEDTFWKCFNIKRVILADTVIRIQRWAFYGCKNLVFIKWSIHLEYIGIDAFQGCNLSSVFIPPRCREIGDEAFSHNKNLTILNISQDTELGEWIINHTELRERYERYSHFNDIPVNTWLKNINHNDQFDLHRVCASYEPTLDMILNTMIQKGGPQAFKVKNSICITPSRYLKENQYAEVTEKDIIKKYVLQMTGEVFQEVSIFFKETIAEKEMLQTDVRRLIKTLSPREQAVIRLRFGLDDGTPRTLDYIAQKFNVDKERIRKFEAKALLKLRQPYRNQSVKCYISDLYFVL